MEVEVEPYRPVSRRRRVLIALLAVATAAFVTWAMTRNWGIVRYTVQHPADVVPCTPGQSEGCVGSMTSVIALPAAAAPSAAPATSAPATPTR